MILLKLVNRVGEARWCICKDDDEAQALFRQCRAVGWDARVVGVTVGLLQEWEMEARIRGR